MVSFELSIRTQGSLLTDPTVGQRFDREITATLQELGALGQNRVVSRTPAGISAGGGGLRGSIFTELHGTPAARGQRIASSVYYAPIVELGRRAGQKRPPLGPIMLWLQRRVGVRGPDLRSAAFLVARKIGRSGTVGARMFERTAVELRPIVQNRFAALAARIGELLK